MTDIVLAGASLAALLAAYPLMILHDVLRRPETPGPAPADRGGMTATGVPYVRGNSL
jgi:hypothetical protein